MGAVHGVTSSWAGPANDGTQTYYQDYAHSDHSEDRLTGVSQYCFSQCEGWTKKLRRTR